ncbi:lysylphosphatidylglycerol synthase transmembrane domain-containing protein [Actinomadura macrotermitis]|uniref:Flippase-like domain-containing protein n=1 Tax=Actinomadura macrotermitis TaxID=2585200 RepID=A0A7K0BMW9_9ACTN|nr:lysylphosphatidylglycerol synthase domain-containing protein [Actinomadura macrotermitis]MQY02426.1 hypothetical protein [Actinomadura macrotermitis]
MDTAQAVVAPPRWAARLRLAVTAGVIALTVALAVGQWETVEAGVRSLAGADPAWVAAGLAANAATWIAALGMQYGSMRVRPGPGRLIGVQFAVTGVSPVPGAGAAVYIRYLRREGLNTGEIVGVFLLMGLAAGVARVLYLLASLPAAPAGWRRATERWSDWRPAPDAAWSGPVPAGAVLIVLGLGCALLAFWLTRRDGARRARRLARGLRARIAADMLAVRAVAAHRGRAAGLWLGALALPALNALTLYAMLRALGVRMGPGSVLVVYMLVTTLAALLPAPNGIGSTEVVMTAGLVLGGVPAAPALGAALGFRLVTFWGALPPGIAAFAYLSRRRVL